MNYGSEVWTSQLISKLDVNNLISYCKKPITERVFIKHAKVILGVHSKASTMSVRGELGLFPNLFTQIKHYVKYYTRLQEMPPSTFAYKSLLECLSLQEGNSQCWLNGVKNLMSYQEFISDIDHNSSSFSIHLDHLLQDKYKQQW